VICTECKRGQTLEVQGRGQNQNREAEVEAEAKRTKPRSMLRPLVQGRCHMLTIKVTTIS